jgi:hypothetical protein
VFTGLFDGEGICCGREKAGSTRDKAALRNDKRQQLFSVVFVSANLEGREAGFL